MTVSLARHLMGTRFEVVLEDPVDPARLRSAGEEALDEIERLDHQLSAYRPGSDISGLNARAGAEWIRVEPRLFRLLEQAAALVDVTHGAFDPTVAPLLRVWGFVHGRGHWPEARDVEAARGLTGPGRMGLDSASQSVRFDRPGVALDLGAIGKGYALERAAALLRENNVRQALLHGGTSTVTTLGRWTVAVADPRQEHRELARVALQDGESLSVSGPHGKSFVGPDGQTFGHVLDPRSGWPVQGVVLAAVVAKSATETDALSTALLVLGMEGLDTLTLYRPSFSALILTRAGETVTRGTAFESSIRQGIV